MSAPRKTLVKYTGKEKIRTMIGNQEFVEWKNGDVYAVFESKVRNHIKYPFFELADENAKAKEVKVEEPKTEKKSKSVKRREAIQKEEDVEVVEEGGETVEEEDSEVDPPADDEENDKE